ALQKDQGRIGLRPWFTTSCDELRASEFVAECGLYLPRPINDIVAAAAGYPEILISGPAVNPSECVTVEGVRDIELEQDILALSDTCSLDDGKVLIHVPRTTPPGDCSGKVAKDIASPGCKRGGAGIYKGGAVSSRRTRIVLNECAVR